MNDREQQEIEDRRKFLISAGRFAAVTPPAITLLLSTSLTSDAIAGSGNNGRYGGPKGKTATATGVATAAPTARKTSIAKR